MTDFEECNVDRKIAGEKASAWESPKCNVCGESKGNLIAVWKDFPFTIKYWLCSKHSGLV